MATKNPSWTRPVALAGVLTVLSTTVYWLEFKKKPESEKKKEQEKKVFLLDQSQAAEITIIQGLSLVRLGCLDLSTKQCLAGTNSKWELRSPAKLRADDVNVQSLLSSLNNLLPTDSIELSAETPEKRSQLLAQYGLSDEQRKSGQRVEVTDESGGQTALILGDAHPLGETRFALVERGSKNQGWSPDSKVLIVPLALKDTLSKPLTHWRNKKILTVLSGDVSAIRLKNQKSSFEAVKKDGQWTISGRENGRSYPGLPGDIENIDNWISAITYLSAREFAAEQKDSPDARKVLSGSRPILEIALSKSKENPIVLQVHEKKSKNLEKLFITASNLDPVFELEPAARQRLEKSLQDLRLARLLGSMDRFNAREVILNSPSLGKTPITFAKKDGKWSRQGGTPATPNPGQDDDAKITAILDHLSGNKVRNFLPERKPSKDLLEISLKDEKAQVIRHLQFWKDGDRALGRDLFSKRPETLEIDPSLASALPWDKL